MSGLLDSVAGSLTTFGSLSEFLFRREGQEPTYSQEVDGLLLGIIGISTFVFVVLMTLMVYWAIKYRRRPGVAAPRSSSHNTALEITWTVIPSIIFIGMFFVGFRTYAKQQTAPPDAVLLDLNAYKWGWDLSYNGQTLVKETTMNGAVQIPVFLVPEDTPIQLQMQSADVLHSFWVPDFRFKMDVIPNRFTNYWFRTPKLQPGDRDNAELDYDNKEHWVFCAEYCGDQHSEMAAILRVVPHDVFRAFLLNPFEPGTPPREIGQFVYSYKCATCHSVDGSSGQGPTWKNLFGYEHQYTDGTKVVADANHIVESILYPATKIRSGYGNQMASYEGQLNDQQLRGLIAYMRSLSDKGQSIELDPFEIEPVEDGGDADPTNNDDGAPGDGQDADGDGAPQGETEG